MTALPQPLSSISPMLCFDTEVLRVRRVSPSFVRITFGGDGLVDFCDGGALGPRDTRIKLVVPAAPGLPAPPLTDLAAGWYPRWLALDPAVRGELRTYTVRAVRHREIDVDFVLHGDGGPASAWAEAARPGDRMCVLGPNARNPDQYGGIEWAPPVTPAQVLLVGDETAVPAIASILATLPAGYAGRAVLEVPEVEDFQVLDSEADVEVTWLARGSHAHGALLRAVVREVLPARGVVRPVADIDPDDLVWETPTAPVARGAGAPYVWIAGEAAVVRALRRYLVGEVGLPRDSVAFMGYWRHTHAG